MDMDNLSASQQATVEIQGRELFEGAALGQAQGPRQGQPASGIAPRNAGFANLAVTNRSSFGGPSEFGSSALFRRDVVVGGCLRPAAVLGPMRGMWPDVQRLREAVRLPHEGWMAYTDDADEGGAPRLWRAEGGRWVRAAGFAVPPVYVLPKLDDMERQLGELAQRQVETRLLALDNRRAVESLAERATRTDAAITKIRAELRAQAARLEEHGSELAGHGTQLGALRSDMARLEETARQASARNLREHQEMRRLIGTAQSTADRAMELGQAAWSALGERLDGLGAVVAITTHNRGAAGADGILVTASLWVDGRQVEQGLPSWRLARSTGDAAADLRWDSMHAADAADGQALLLPEDFPGPGLEAVFTFTATLGSQTASASVTLTCTEAPGDAGDCECCQPLGLGDVDQAFGSSAPTGGTGGTGSGTGSGGGYDAFTDAEITDIFNNA